MSENLPGAVARGSRRAERRARRASPTGTEPAREAPRAAPPAGAPKEEASRPGLAEGGRANTMSEKAPLRLVNGSYKGTGCPKGQQQQQGRGVRHRRKIPGSTW